VEKCETSKEAWDALAAVFASKSVARKMQLLRELMQLRLLPGEKLVVYTARVNALVHRLKDVGYEVAELVHVAVLLNGLPKSFETVVTVLEASDKELDVTTVVARLREAEQRTLNETAGAQELALVAKSKAGPRRPKGPCWNCGELGHVRAECTHPKKDKDRANLVFAL